MTLGEVLAGAQLSRLLWPSVSDEEKKIYQNDRGAKNAHPGAALMKTIKKRFERE